MDQKNPEKTGFVQLAYHYTRSLSHWIKAGRPKRSDEGVRYENRQRLREKLSLQLGKIRSFLFTHSPHEQS